MAKDTERKTAKILYTEQGKSAKDVAKLVGVTENTISKWVNKYNWKTAKTANAISHKNRIENIYKIIEELSSDRLQFNSKIKDLIKGNTKENKEEIRELRQEIVRTDMAVANWNKTLDSMKKENQINQLNFIQIQQIIFKHFHSKYPELTGKVVEFEEYMLNEVIPTFTQ